MSPCPCRLNGSGSGAIGDDTITLEGLARSMLSHSTDATGSGALLIDREGLAIDATDPALAAEIDQINSEAGAAVLYFRTADGIKRLGTQDAVASQATQVSPAVERLLRQAERSGWLVVLMGPPTPST